VGLVLPALPGVGGRLFVAIYADFILAINNISLILRIDNLLLAIGVSPFLLGLCISHGFKPLQEKSYGIVVI
jgi:hypothetical protein